MVLLFAVLLAATVFVFAGCNQEEEEPVSDVVEEAEPEWSPEVLFQKGFEDRIQSLAFSPDGEILAVGYYLKADLLRASDGELIQSIDYRHSVDDLDFSPDGNIVGGGQNVYGVILNAVDDGSEIIQLHGGYNAVLAFSPDGETIATGNREGIVWMWNIADGEELAAFEPDEPDFLTAVEFTPDGERVIASDFSGKARVWEVDTGDLIYTFDVDSIVEDIAVSPEGDILAVSGGREIFLYDLTDGGEIEVISAASSAKALDFSDDGNMFAYGGVDGMLNVLETSDWTLQHELEHFDEEGEADRVNALAISPDSKHIAVGTWDGEVYMWQVQE